MKIRGRKKKLMAMWQESPSLTYCYFFFFVCTREKRKMRNGNYSHWISYLNLTFSIPRWIIKGYESNFWDYFKREKKAVWNLFAWGHINRSMTLDLLLELTEYLTKNPFAFWIFGILRSYSFAGRCWCWFRKSTLHISIVDDHFRLFRIISPESAGWSSLKVNRWPYLHWPCNP